MLSPMMTVAVLAVLWLIVVVPMIVKRKDDRAGARSIARFGGAMQALSVRRTLANLARPVPNFDDELSSERPAKRFSRPQVFVPGKAVLGSLPSRAPQPRAMDALIHSDRVAKADMSDARRDMMARRKRSLTVLIAGTVIGLGWLIAAGGTLPMLASVGFVIGLGGYVYFLRTQAVRDRARRESRIRRISVERRHDVAAPRMAPVEEQLTERIAEYAYAGAENAVRIDDDDAELLGLAETIDLTGLYSEDHFDEAPMRRAV